MAETPPEIVNQPFALLIGRDGDERVWRLATLQPPSMLYMPVLPPLSLRAEPDATMPTRTDRAFRLAPHLRASSHRWWLKLPNVPGITSEHAFVYLEEPPHA